MIFFLVFVLFATGVERLSVSHKKDFLSFFVVLPIHRTVRVVQHIIVDSINLFWFNIWQKSIELETKLNYNSWITNWISFNKMSLFFLSHPFNRCYSCFPCNFHEISLISMIYNASHKYFPILFIVCTCRGQSFAEKKQDKLAENILKKKNNDNNNIQPRH